MNPMRLMTLLIGALSAIMLVFLPVAYMRRTEADRSARRVRKQFGKTVEALKDYTSEHREKALSKAQKSLEGLDSRIADMEQTLYDRWDLMERDARESYRSTIADLQRQRTRVAEWYGALEHSSQEAWEAMKEGFLNSYRDLESSFEKIPGIR